MHTEGKIVIQVYTHVYTNALAEQRNHNYYQKCFTLTCTDQRDRATATQAESHSRLLLAPLHKGIRPYAAGITDSTTL